MPETTKAPTEEMRKTASWCVQNMLPDSEHARAKGIEARIAVALAAQDALKTQIVYIDSEEGNFHQGPQEPHELLEPVTAKELNALKAEVKTLRAIIKEAEYELRFCAGHVSFAHYTAHRKSVTTSTLARMQAALTPAKETDNG